MYKDKHHYITFPNRYAAEYHSQAILLKLNFCHLSQLLRVLFHQMGEKSF